MITSAYGKGNVQNALNNDQLLYVDPDKKRTAAWLGSTGLQLPVAPTKYGSMGRLTYWDGSVKMIQSGSRNAKLAQFLTQDEDSTHRLDVKYSLPAMASETDVEKTKRQEALTIRPAQMNPERTARVSETDWPGQKTQDVYKAIRTAPVRAELKLYDNWPTALYMAIAETTAEESRNSANKKEPGLRMTAAQALKFILPVLSRIRIARCVKSHC